MRFQMMSYSFLNANELSFRNDGDLKIAPISKEVNYKH